MPKWPLKSRECEKQPNFHLFFLLCCNTSEETYFDRLLNKTYYFGYSHIAKLNLPELPRFIFIKFRWGN